MAVRFQLRRDTAANWASANSVLALGEPGVETDTLKVKVGDGSTAWNSLAYSITKDFTDLTSKPSTLAGYGITDSLALNALSVTQNAASGDGALTYNNATGVFSYTPPNFEGLSGNFTGSVFADDSTIMVDGVAATLNLANNTTTDLTEGTNLYYTDVRADARITNALIDEDNMASDSATKLPSQQSVKAYVDAQTTSETAEGTNLYYTDVRADARIAAASITDLSDADQTVQTTDNVTFSSVTGNVITSQIDSADSSAIEIQTDVEMLAGLTVGNHIIPSSSENIDLGSASARFRDLYLSGNSAVIGDLALKRHASGGLLVSDHSTGNPTNLTTHDIVANNITTAGYLRGPASFVIDPAAFGDDTGTVVIAGNLQVDGVQTTINSTTVSIDDLNFSIATDAADSAAANGAGITVGGAGATLNYTHATTSWDMNKPLNVTGNIGVTGTVDGVDIATRDAILTSTTTTAGAALPKAGGTMTGNLRVDHSDQYLVGIKIRNNHSSVQSDWNVGGSGGTSGWGATNGNFIIRDDTTNSTGIEIEKGAGGAAGALYIDSNGNVGIGTTAPTATLDVAGTALVENAKLKAIAKDISDTAVDVFVYDTSKDSDGGAWRKRTQHTSWYNEALNTSTRGARKEFPSVAVIVAEADTITIYDGDDPDMPMWMVFSPGGILDWPTSTHTRINVAALNGGIVAVTEDGGEWFSFIDDTTYILYSSLTYNVTSDRSIVNRNGASTYTSTGGAVNTYAVAHYAMNDVAMTVLPNAPIDAGTGLPVPTIAVATNGGVSVIKDDGTVVDITVDNASYTFARRVNFLSDNSLGMGIGVADGVAQESYYIFNNIPTSDNVITVDNIAGTTQNVDEFYAIQSPNSLVDLQLLGLDSNRALRSSTGNSFASDEGLSVISRNVGAPDKGLISYIASDYNTGWMHGDIKLATLSDTDTTNAVGTELVTNGTFASDTSWTKGTGWTISGGTAVASSVASGVKIESTAFTVTAGYYTIALDVTTSASTYYYGILGATNAGTSIKSTQGTVSITVYLNAGSHYAYIGAWSSGLSGTFDNFSVRLAELDRSYNGNGLQTFGTVTKTAVATGAELVGYSGFSSSNYLQHTVSTNYGSPAVISFMGWQKTSDISEYQYMASLIDGTSGNLFGLSVNSSATGADAGKPYFYDSVNSSLQATRTVNDGGWHFMVAVMDGTSKKLYIDGELNASATVTALAMTNVTNTNVGFYKNSIGGTKQYFHLGSIALIRISATAPTPEQIAKMYNDEKFLFQENAKATLYGTSDSVTALAYDDDTELLHVGTSAGRSVFQGLRRVDNTTDAVGAAISASNGLVAED
jgi:trimeric autotransporter adhesin